MYLLGVPFGHGWLTKKTQIKHILSDKPGAYN